MKKKQPKISVPLDPPKQDLVFHVKQHEHRLNEALKPVHPTITPVNDLKLIDPLRTKKEGE